MYRIETKIDTASAQFRENTEKNKALHREFKERLDKIKLGGPEKSRARHL